MNKDKYYVHDKECGCWMHRTPLKCFINPILRKIQFWTKEPLVICSKTDFDENCIPHFKGYGMVKTRVMTAQEYNELKKKEGNQIPSFYFQFPSKFLYLELLRFTLCLQNFQ